MRNAIGEKQCSKINLKEHQSLQLNLKAANLRSRNNPKGACLPRSRTSWNRSEAEFDRINARAGFNNSKLDISPVPATFIFITLLKVT